MGVGAEETTTTGKDLKQDLSEPKENEGKQVDAKESKDDIDAIDLKQDKVSAEIGTQETALDKQEAKMKFVPDQLSESTEGKAASDRKDKTKSEAGENKQESPSMQEKSKSDKQD